MGEILQGVKVLEFGQYIAGPYAARLLAEQGADVVKVERPGGDPYRPAAGFAVCNRSKMGITLNLKTPKGLEIARRLAQDADVVIENFRPGVADRLGIGYEELKKINPRLIYCAISGFGRKGPYRDVPGWEPLVLSLATVFSEQNRVGDPVYQSMLPASHNAGLLGAYYIVAALYGRELTGNGERIDLSLLRAAVAMQPNLLANSPRKTFFPLAVRGLLPLVRAYQGGDGAWLIINVTSYGLFTALCQSMGHPEWVKDPLFEGAPYYIMPPRMAQVTSRLQAEFRSRTRDEWIGILQAARVICSPVQSVEEFMKSPQLDANNLMVRVEENGLGEIREVNNPLEISGMTGKVKGPSPRPGQHTGTVLQNLGYSAGEIQELRGGNII